MLVYQILAGVYPLIYYILSVIAGVYQILVGVNPQINSILSVIAGV